MAVRYNLRTLNGVRRQVLHPPQEIEMVAADVPNDDPEPEPPRFYRGEREARALGIAPEDRDPDPEAVLVYPRKHWWQRDPTRCQGWKKTSGATPVQCSRRLPARGGAYCYQHTQQRRDDSAILRQRHTAAEQTRATLMRQHVDNARREHRTLLLERRRFVQDRLQREEMLYVINHHPELRPRLHYINMQEPELIGGIANNEPTINRVFQRYQEVIDTPDDYRMQSFPCRQVAVASDRFDRDMNIRNGRFEDLRDRQTDTMSIYDVCHPTYEDCDNEEPGHRHAAHIQWRCNICRRYSPPERIDEYVGLPERWYLRCRGCSVFVHRFCQQTELPFNTHLLYKCTFCLDYGYDAIDYGYDADVEDSD